LTARLALDVVIAAAMLSLLLTAKGPGLALPLMPAST